MNGLQLRVLTPERELLEAEVREVVAPGVLGELGILPHHIRFIGALGIGELRARGPQGEHRLAISGGVLEVVDDVVTVLADTAEPAGAIDIDRAAAARRRAEERLGSAEPLSPDALEAEETLRRAVNRLRVAGQRR